MVIEQDRLKLRMRLEIFIDMKNKKKYVKKTLKTSKLEKSVIIYT